MFVTLVHYATSHSTEALCLNLLRYSPAKGFLFSRLVLGELTFVFSRFLLLQNDYLG